MNLKIGILAIFLLLILIAAGCGNGGTGNFIGGCPQYSCAFQQRAIAYELGSQNAEGKGILGSTVSIPLTNRAEIGALFQVTIDCKTLNKAETLKTDQMYIRPGETYTFKVKLGTGLAENWQCSNYQVTYDGGTECVLNKI
jgi:hypothetical protein